MTAERLRQAATKLRELEASAASGPWRYDRMSPGTVTRVYSRVKVANSNPETAQFIAAMHPGVALAVADWLDNTADCEWDPEYYQIGPVEHAALAVADAVLGES